MIVENILALFLVIVAAVVGGIISKALRLPTLVGYIISGIAFGAVLSTSTQGILSLAQVGTILLLFSIGVELSLKRLSKYFKIAFFGAIIQILAVTAVFYFLIHIFGFSSTASLVLALGFSLSSTAVVVKILSDRGELQNPHGGIMLGWLLVQDLAVVPIMVILPAIGGGSGAFALPIFFSLVKSIAAVGVAVFLGKTVVPYLIHKVAALNQRELLLLTSVALALGTAVAAALIGISSALGAFLAGFVISESQEHHAVFAETRPLRDLFVAFFFVSLGFLVSPTVILSNIGLILLIVALVLLIKSIIVFVINVAFGYKGRSAVSVSLGLSQIGEFAFIIFSQALILGLITSEETSLAIAVTLLTLVVTPLTFKFAFPLWRWLKEVSNGTSFYTLFSSGEKGGTGENGWKNHIIICGYGRVGKWVGKMMREYNLPFVVIEYDRKIVGSLKSSGVDVIYGDPSEPEIMEAADIRSAKAVILAIPDRIAQETLIAYIQTVAPGVKIISRVHNDEDWKKLKTLRVGKIVQPEFEAALAIVRGVLAGMGKPVEEINRVVRGLRLSHSK